MGLFRKVKLEAMALASGSFHRRALSPFHDAMASDHRFHLRSELSVAMAAEDGAR